MGKRTLSDRDRSDAQDRSHSTAPIRPPTSQSPSTTASLPTKALSGPSRLRYKRRMTTHAAAAAAVTTISRSRATTTILSLEGSLSEEILLRCLSFLNASDLATVARVSSGWNRLSQDPQLWRTLYLETYCSRSTMTSSSPTWRHQRPWKELYKVSTNWRNGVARSTTATVLTTSVRKAVLARSIPADLSLSSSSPSSSSSPLLSQTRAVAETRDRFAREVETVTQQDLGSPPHESPLLQVHEHYFFSASKRPETPNEHEPRPPVVTVFETDARDGYSSRQVATFSSARLDRFYRQGNDRPVPTISELRLDDHIEHDIEDDDANVQDEPEGGGFVVATRRRIAVFFSTGQFSIFEIDFLRPRPSHPDRQYDRNHRAFPLAPRTPSSETNSLAIREIYCSISVRHDHQSPTRPRPSTATTTTTLPCETVSIARFHSPLLVTCSTSLTLRFYNIYGSSPSRSGKQQVNEGRNKRAVSARSDDDDDDDDDRPWIRVEESTTRLQTNERGWDPIALTFDKMPRLSNSPSSSLFRVSLVYSLPVFPSDSTVGLQEFEVVIDDTAEQGDHGSGPRREKDSIKVSTRVQATCHVPLDLTRSPRLAPDYGSHTGADGERRQRARAVTSIEYAPPFIVTSRIDNTIQVYRVVDVSEGSSGGSSVPPLSRQQRGGGGLHTRARVGSPRGDNETDEFGRRGGRERSGNPRMMTSRRKVEIRLEKTLFGHTARVGSVALLTDVLLDDDDDDKQVRRDTSTSEEEEAEDDETGSTRAARDDGTIKLVSAGDDGTFKVWHLASPSRDDGARVTDIRATSPSRGRKRRGEEEDDDDAPGRDESEWDRLKRARLTRTRTRTRPERVERIWVDRDKIVVLDKGRSDERTVRVLRFD